MAVVRAKILIGTETETRKEREKRRKNGRGKEMLVIVVEVVVELAGATVAGRHLTTKVLVLPVTHSRAL